MAKKYGLKYAITHLNKKFKAKLTAGLTVTLCTGMLGTGIAVLTSCGKTDDKKAKTEVETQAPQNDQPETTTEATTEQVTEEDLVIPEEAAEFVADNQVEYDKIDTLENDIVTFAQNSLPNGFVEVNEDNKLDMAEMFTDGYVMMNLSTRDNEINKSTVKVLNQKGNLSARVMIDNYQKFNYQIGDYMQIVTPDTKINFENLVAQADDAKFLNELEEEIAQMNVATTREERQKRIDNIIAIRNSIITDYVTTSYSASTYYTAINMIIKADATARAYGNEIFPDEEAKVQLYTTLEKVCEEEYAGKYKDAEYELDVESIGASQTSAESRYLNEVANFLKEAVESKADQQYNEYYSYGQVTLRISEKIFGLYKAPAMNAVEKENSIRESISNSLTPSVGTVSVQEVPISQVPEAYRETPEIIVDRREGQTTTGADVIKDAKESNDVYISAKGAGISAGSSEAAAAYMSTYAGNAEAMPVKPVGAAPSTTSQDYNAIYTYFYNIEWNAYRSSAIAKEEEARRQNEQATTEFEKEEEPEVIIEETVETFEENQTMETETIIETETVTETSETETVIEQETIIETPVEGTTFIPVESEEEIIEEIIEDVVISSNTKPSRVLAALRQELVSMYLNAYNTDNTNSKVKVNVKGV